MRGVLHAAMSSALVLALAACGTPTEESSSTDGDLQKVLDEFAKRKIYRQLDPQVLASIPDAEVEQAVFDYAASKLEGHSDEEARIVRTLPPGVRALYLTWIVESEVENGGFNQYYWNTDDRFSEQAVEEFEFFHATQHAAIMREANAVRAKEKDALARYKKQNTLQSFSDSYEETKLGPLDERFYNLQEDLSALRIARIRAAPALFSGN